MTEREVAIYSSIYTVELVQIETALRVIFHDGTFTKIEKDAVLLYQDTLTDISIEIKKDLCYLTGRHKSSIENASLLIKLIIDCFNEMNISYSLDYQEEDLNGIPTSPEFNISVDSEKNNLLS